MNSLPLLRHNRDDILHLHDLPSRSKVRNKEPYGVFEYLQFSRKRQCDGYQGGLLLVLHVTQ